MQETIKIEKKKINESFRISPYRREHKKPAVWVRDRIAKLHSFYYAVVRKALRVFSLYIACNAAFSHTHRDKDTITSLILSCSFSLVSIDWRVSRVYARKKDAQNSTRSRGQRKRFRHKYSVRCRKINIKQQI